MSKMIHSQKTAAGLPFAFSCYLIFPLLRERGREREFACAEERVYERSVHVIEISREREGVCR